MSALTDRLNRTYVAEGWGWRMAEYSKRPQAFAFDILNSLWWSGQEDIAKAVAYHRRVAVKSANGVGKTYLAADLVLWFLYTHQPAIVLTTAPTWRQVRFVLWEEIKRRFKSARVRLPGALFTTRITAGDGWYALGLATDDDVKFQGFHAEHMLIIFDEASGIPDPIWDAAEGVAVGANNRILAIGNPLRASGRFYQIFSRNNDWTKRTITALEHPNIDGRGHRIPGCITRDALAARIADWCEPTDASTASTESTPSTTDLPASEGRSAKGHPARQFIAGSSQTTPNETQDARTSQPDVFIWENKTYRPNNLFRARFLGEFPNADEDTLIPLRWIEAAMERELPAPESGAIRKMAADIARFGDDLTVIGLRTGLKVTNLQAIQGADNMEVAGKIRQLAYELHPEAIAIDSIGLGAGVVDRLRELKVEGIQAINVNHAAHDSERFANRRAELYWGLRERFRLGEISIPHNDSVSEQLANIKYRITSMGQIQIESKDAMKRRGLKSPDYADMLALLFDGAGDAFLRWCNEHPIHHPEPSPAAQLRAEMARW